LRSPGIRAIVVGSGDRYRRSPPIVTAVQCLGYNRGMALYLFAGIPVNDYAAALAWYERLLGAPATFFPSDTEAVWELADQRSVYIKQRPEHAGHAMHTILVEDLDARIAQIAERGLEPAMRETYENDVRKITYRDPDGNEFGFGDAPG
jgi:predicted enzyme related to lactoylglutathione lyase